ncbi:MAG: LuxR C-terminal-related transcriptional regulator [Thermomicrobiales bacterium]
MDARGGDRDHLFGRAFELATLTQLLTRAEARLVTIVGPGGVGKTRLAEACADHVVAAFADGATMVRLADIRDPHRVMPAVIQALGLQLLDESAAYLAGILGERQVLLVLDTMEHLTAAASDLDTLTDACPHLRILATSRVPLHRPHEQVFTLEPFTLPDLASPATPGHIAGYAAVQLFVARARTHQPGLALTTETVDAIVAICRQTDGLPLAIELAAARAAVQPLSDIAPSGHQGAGPDDLTRGIGDMVAWSYRLLDPATRTLFRQLAVFTGGAAMEEIASIVDGDDDRDVLADRLHILVEANLLVAVPTENGSVRVRMLDTIHEAAWRLLDQAAGTERLRRRHAEVFTARAEKMEITLIRNTMRDAVAWYGTEAENLYAALDYAIDRGDTLLAARLGNALQWFWFASGRWQEAYDRYRQIMALPRKPGMESVWGRLLIRHTGFCALLGHGEEGAEVGALSVELLNDLDDRESLAFAYTTYGFTVIRDHDLATATLRTAVDLYRTTPDRWGLAMALYNQAEGHKAWGEFEAAFAAAEGSLAIARETGSGIAITAAVELMADLEIQRGNLFQAQVLAMESLHLAHEMGFRRSVTHSSIRLGIIALRIGDPVAARSSFQEAVEIAHVTGDVQSMAEALEGLGLSEVATHSPRRAMLLLASAEAIRAIWTIPAAPNLRPMRDAIAELRPILGDAEADAIQQWAATRTLADHAALALSDAPDPNLSPPSLGSRPTLPDTLTRREREVLVLVADGLTDRQIAERLFISRPTASKHVKAIMTKLGVHSRSAAAAIAGRHRP